ncbi:MAG: ABC transporter permease [Rhizobiaceae bacterium]|nr:ABC transporter permease [Rhizobiaceae bacterium]
MIRAAFASTAITAGFCLFVLLVVLVPVALLYPEPGEVLSRFLLGPFEKTRYMGNIVELATPSMLTALAVVLMFRCGAFNLGVEGSFFLGGLTTAAMVLWMPLPPLVGIPLALLAGAIVGSVVCGIPGIVKATTGASELVSSLMLNYAAVFIGLFVLNYYLRDPTAAMLSSDRFPAEYRFESLIPRTRIHIGSIVAVVACIIGAIYLNRTSQGLEVRISGTGNDFSRHLGLNSVALNIRIQVIGGMIAAFAGGIEMLGLYSRFTWQNTTGNGWTGVIVAIIARDNPILIIPAALFIGYLQVGGDLVSRAFGVPTEIVSLIQALVMICVTSVAIFQHPALRKFVQGDRGGAAQ